MVIFFLPFSGFATLAIHGQTCIMGKTNLQPSRANSNSGLFIQEQSRAPCDGQIIRWTVCYYSPRPFFQRQSYQFLLEVWRRVNNRKLNIIGSNLAAITLPNQDHDFVCVNITVDSAERIDVQQGDYLGVFTSSDFTEVLPVVNANAGFSSQLYFCPSCSNPSSVFLSGSGLPRAIELSNQAIHVFATIGNCDR